MSFGSYFVSIEEAAQILNLGHVVAFPTDTVYGIGCASNAVHRESIFRLKGRPAHKKLTCYVCSVDDIYRVSGYQDDGTIQQLEKYFLPGPLTLVVPNYLKRVCPDYDTLAFRIVNHLSLIHI